MDETIPNRSSPIFNEIDSTPEEGLPYTLKLCFCPLCEGGYKKIGLDKIVENKGVVSWQLLCRAIVYSLTCMNTPRTFFSLNMDIYWFVVDHWWIFGKLNQFRTNPSKWKKSLLDALSHSSYFQSGTSDLKKTGLWKLTHYAAPWDTTTETVAPALNHKAIKAPPKQPTQSMNNVDKTELIKNCNDALKCYQKAYESLEKEVKLTTDEQILDQLKELKDIMQSTVNILHSIDNPNSKQDNSGVLLFTSDNQNV